MLGGRGRKKEGLKSLVVDMNCILFDALLGDMRNE